MNKDYINYQQILSKYNDIDNNDDLIKMLKTKLKMTSAIMLYENECNLKTHSIEFLHNYLSNLYEAVLIIDKYNELKGFSKMTVRDITMEDYIKQKLIKYEDV